MWSCLGDANENQHILDFHRCIKSLLGLLKIISWSSLKVYSLNPNQSNFYWFTSAKYLSLVNQLIFTGVISEIWLIHSNLFLAIWISQISLIISRSWLIQNESTFLVIRREGLELYIIVESKRHYPEKSFKKEFAPNEFASF